MFLHVIKMNSLLLVTIKRGMIIPHCIDPFYYFWIFEVMLVF